MPALSTLTAKVQIDTSDIAPQLESTQRALTEGLGSAAQQAQLRVDALSERIGFQQRQLGLLAQTLDQAKQKYGDGAQQVERLQLSYDRLGASIQQNQRQLPILQQRFQEINSGVQQGAGYAQQFGQALSSSLTSLISPAALAAAGIGALFASINKGKEDAANALELRETTNALRAVSGSMGVYSEAVATARQQQLLFGGSLKDNIDGLQGLVITARDTGANLQALVDLTQRLQIKSPEQGVGGARIALSEAFSEGNITSLARRFEIPRQAIAKLKDESASTEERIKVLSDYLDGIGITSEAAAGRVDESAQAYRRLGVEMGDLSNRSGARIADIFAGAANGIARIVGVINSNPKAIAELRAILQGKSAVSTEDLEQAAREVATRNAQTALGGRQGQFVVTQRLGGADAYHDVIKSLAELELQGQGTKEAGDRLTKAFFDGKLSAQAYHDQLKILVEGESSASDMEDRRARQLVLMKGAVKELTDEERTRLEGQRDTARERATDAYAKLTEADQQYARETADRFQAHQEKLADIQQSGAQRIADINARAAEQQAEADKAYQQRRADLASDLAKHLADLDASAAADAQERAEQHARQLADAQQALVDRLVDLRKASADRIAELEDGVGEASQARQEQRQQRAQDAAERAADLEENLAQRLADFDAQQLDRRQEARERYADRIAGLAQQQADAEQRAREQQADAEARRQEQAADRAQAYQDRLAEQAQAAADRAEDRERDHADRLAAIQEQAQNKTALGRISTLTGERFTTEYQPDLGSGGKSIDQQIAAENERYQKQLEADARDEARQKEKQARDDARQAEKIARDEARQAAAEQREAERRAAQQARALADLEAQYAAEEAKANEKAERDRARILADGDAQRQQLAEENAKREAQQAEQDAKDDARRQQEIAKEREKLAALEADAVADSQKRIARLQADYARETEERAAAAAKTRADAQEKAAEQLADLEAQYIAATAKRAEQANKQRAEVQADTEKRLADEATSYAKQEAQRAEAYARQRDQLKEALGEQLTAFTDYQTKLGEITENEGKRRTQMITDQYLAQAEAQKRAFDAFFGSDVQADRSYDSIEDLRAARPSNGGPGGLNIGSIVLPNVSKPADFLPELRAEVGRQIAANGGDVSKYWSGR